MVATTSLALHSELPIVMLWGESGVMTTTMPTLSLLGAGIRGPWAMTF